MIKIEMKNKKAFIGGFVNGALMALIVLAILYKLLY
jgi:predicted esterase